MALLYIIKGAHASNVRDILLKFYYARARVRCKKENLSFFRRLLRGARYNEFVALYIFGNGRATRNVRVIPYF